MRPARMLKNTLQSLCEKLGTLRTLPSSKTVPSTMSASIDYDFKIKKKEHQLELEIQEAFLRFMASILKGYRTYLRPITTAPTIGTTDTNSLFDLNGFQRSRDKTYSRFFNLLTKTQMFIRFIEERSFVSDKDASLAFFDECTEKIDSYDGSESKFLEVDDSHTSDRTVFIAPPEPIGLPPGLEYKYKQFGTLKPQLFHKHPSKTLLSVFAQSSPPPSSPLARRTKQEIKSAQKMARKQSENSVTWAKCLAGYCFSLWFIHLPSYVKMSSSKSSALRMAFNVLVHMQQNKLTPPDEVCYRVLMLLCGLYSQPTLAVKVLFEMKQHGIQPNAITYGYYNKAVLESKWPSADSGSTLMWNRLRNVIIGVAQFRQGVKRKTRRSLSLCSEVDYDRISRTSTECSNPDELTFVKIQNPTEFVNDLVNLVDHQSESGGLKEGSNCSINQDEGLKLSSSATSSNSMIEEETEVADCEPFKKNCRLNGEKRCSARCLKFQEIDFSASDAFRCRVGSIVRCSATSIGSLAQLQDATVDSAAGILMTSQASLLEDCMLNVSCDMESRRRHKSAGDFKCSGKHSYRLRHCSGPVSEDLTESGNHSPFLRSYSFGCDAQIISKIKEARNKVQDCDSTSQVLNSSVKKTLVAEKKKDDKDQKSKSFGLSRCDEEPETEMDVVDCASPQTSEKDLHDIASNTPLPNENTKSSFVEQSPAKSDASSDTFSTDISSGTLVPTDNEESTTEKTPSTSMTNGILQGIRDKDFLSSFSPIKEAWLNLDIGNSIPRMASNISSSLGLGGSSDKDSTNSRSNKVTRSSTFHNGSCNNTPRRAKSKVDSLTDLDVNGSGKMSLSRSSTLPVPPRSKSVCHKLPGMQSSSPGFPSSPSTFGISRLTSRHSEILIDGLKSAVSSVSTKINEIRSSLSASSTPTKGNYSGTSGSLDTEKMTMYGSEERCNLSRDGHRSSVDYLSGSSHSDDVFNGPDYFLSDALHRSREQRLSLPHCGSAPAFSSQVYDLLERHSDVHSDHSNIPRTAMEITMTTCSRCFTCASLLYDEEIMEGWSADDSNLNTQCTFCKAKLVPLLTVNIRDFRWEGSVESLLTPAYSTESVRSAPVCSMPLSFDGTSLQNRPRLLGDRGSTQNSSIDSGNEAFILLEDSPENDENVSYNNAKNKRYQSLPPNYLRKSIEDGSDIQKDPASSYSSRNSTSSLFEEDIFGSLPSSTNAKGSQQSPSTSSSIGDVRKSSTNALPHTIDPITVPYLSPLVLRKEVENVLDHEGDNCLTKPEFVDQHPIIYWNLVWFFKRIGVPSHLPGLVLQADTVNKGKQIPDIWQKGDSKNVVIHCAWDNVKLHEDRGPPLYLLWKQHENGSEQSSLVHALITEERKASKSVMKHVLAKLQCNDLQSPISMLINERRKSGRKHHHSIYREILFLSFVAIGRKNIDNMSFDLNYRKAFENLSNKQLNQTLVNDKPVSNGAVFCRAYFKDLELKLP